METKFIFIIALKSYTYSYANICIKYMGVFSNIESIFLSFSFS